MKKYIFLIIGFIFLFVNLFYIGILKYNNQNTAELFVKHRPNLKMVFESNRNNDNSIKVDFKRDDYFYREFITNRNVEDKSKSFLPLIFIQIMLSCFSIFFTKIDFVRKLVLFPIHFILCLFGLFQFIVYAFNIANRLLSVLIFLGIIILNYLAAYFFTKSKEKAK